MALGSAVATPVQGGGRMSIDVANPAQTAVSTERGVVLIRMGSASRSRLHLTPARLEALADALRAAAGNGDAALVLLASETREFCLGADVDRLLHAPPHQAAAYLRLGQTVMDALADLPIPVIAAVGGPALGGGFELAMACDFCWAAARAVFGLPECGHRLVPAWGGISALRQRLPPATAWELFSGQRITARRAFELGLVGRVCDAADFIPRAIDAAAGIATVGRDTLMALKQLWRSTDCDKDDRPALRTCLNRVEMLRRRG